MNLDDYIISEKEEGVILCSPCKGSGIIREGMCVYDDVDVTCGACEGSGRLVKISIQGYKAFKGA